ncbi:UDP-glucose 6-dehydrogenase [hydrothermal vent metagenome]|uniref:UDP-glucose 6-dehydrogenase n=1 Tax=hydrothermal vent metagenome TaxID=652676 RepID=A0A3B0SA80_9ZZZZ
MRVAMVGTGYVGLVSGACFADFGHDVTCVDLDQDKIAGLQSGKIPIFEPGLEHLVKSNITEGRLRFTTDLQEAVAGADAVFIAVGTPSRRGDGFADLTYVYQAAKDIAHAAQGFTVVVNKSTVPVGTGDEVEKIIRQSNPDADIAVVSNPEFLREGAAISDFKHPDRVVIGTDDDRAIALMKEVYRPLYLNETPILFTSRRSSELIKYAANAYLATKITFINEMADLCEKVGADVQAISRGIGLDKRIGAKFLNAGPGYGGSCFPKDTLALVRTAKEAGSRVQIVETVIQTNELRKKTMAQKVVQACGGQIKGKTVAVLGVSFKPNTDDMREAPALDILPALSAQGAIVRAYDPEAMKEAKTLLPDVVWCSDAYDCAQNADVLVILTEWDQFRALELEKLGEVMAVKTIVDFRNIYTPQDMRQRGFTYVSIGRNGA